MDRKIIDEAFSHMSVDELITSIPSMFDEIHESLPIESKAEFNVVRVKIETAIKNGDMAAMKELQKKYNANQDPTKPVDTFLGKLFKLFK